MSGAPRRPVRRALLDTSVLIDPPSSPATLADAFVVSTISLAELAFGLHVADPLVAAARQVRYGRILEGFDPLPYSTEAARAYGALAEVVRASGQNPRPRRFDLLLASVAVVEDVPLVTRNPRDFDAVAAHCRVIPID